MSTPSDEAQPELRFAEYVLGVLEPEAHAQVEREIAQNASAAAEVAFWQRRLLPLAEELAIELPSPQVWQRVRAQLRLEPAAHPIEPPGGTTLWESLRFWQRFAVAASVLLIFACAAIVALVTQRPAGPPIPYMASALSESGGRVEWTATMDVGKARMIVVPASPQALQAGRSPELWLIPRGGRPLAVAVISATAPVAIHLTAALLAQLGPTATLAVSVEPQGGSPSGQPTGPVIATGSIGAAATTASLLRAAALRG